MEKNNLEIKGCCIVKDFITDCDYIASNINENDKTPSFDGCIIIYKISSKEGSKQKKEFQIYYKSLLLYDLKVILDEKPNNETTINVGLEKLTDVMKFYHECV